MNRCLEKCRGQSRNVLNLNLENIDEDYINCFTCPESNQNNDSTIISNDNDTTIDEYNWELIDELKPVFENIVGYQEMY